MADESGFEAVFNQVVDVLVDELGVPRSKITPESHVFRDLGLDSLDLMTAVTLFEGRFGVTILDEDIGHMLVVKDAADVVLSKVRS
ncbi:phosphopantetheine-binding protein [Streptomyces sp. NPDC060027]|uniref:phosphopantetheine-binding protein n=1 Tax=Streptomyces sp. NPDC060027 TaxID=3347040 RepID=UPI0036CD2410